MGVYEVSVEARFAARHAVRLADGSLEPPHEHPWAATATFRSDRLEEPRGIVVDFLLVQEVLRVATGAMEGKDLNAVVGARGGASAERVAEFLGQAVMKHLAGRAKLYCLTVQEAPFCRAAWYPEGP